MELQEINTDLIIYNSSKFSDQKIICESRSILPTLKEIDLEKVKLNPHFIERILIQLHIPIWQMMNTDSAYYQMFNEHIDELSPQELMKLCCDHPELLQSPIIISHQKSFIPKHITELFSLVCPIH
ncbi:ArsC/Spx/MgsR family protein [Persicobacter psychrovividus]|uniref:Arsenate reductase n=1 Tax=Persicobacter psychrovividus TaxID=387638 RepID=A0ABN6LI72_9BACT|nr:hypothetical protein PEPS_38530 [Persicobacter psychrovividus]